MTAQSPERIVYMGKKLSMCTEPLEDYFSKGGIRPSLQRSSTALWRRYIGSWEVVDDRLYLTELAQNFAGDAFFPETPVNTWQEISRQTAQSTANGLEFSFVVYQRRP